MIIDRHCERSEAISFHVFMRLRIEIASARSRASQ